MEKIKISKDDYFRRQYKPLIFEDRSGVTMGDNIPNMSECERVGMSDGCGSTCYIYLNGECDIEDDINKPESIGDG